MIRLQIPEFVKYLNLFSVFIKNKLSDNNQKLTDRIEIYPSAEDKNDVLEDALLAGYEAKAIQVDFNVT
jgi:hypothetical protein